MSLPFNEDTEKRLICCMMFGPSHVQEVVAGGVTEHFFYVPLHQAIFRALSFCAAAGEPTDPASCWRAMAGLYSPMAQEVESSDRTTLLALLAMSGLESTWIRQNSFLKDVIALHRQRLLLKALASAQEAAVKSYQSWDELMEKVEPHMVDAQRAAEEFACRTNADMIAEARKAVSDPAHTGIDGPFHSWDMESKKLCAGEYLILAGRPSSGKTSLALMYTGSVLKTGLDVALFSLETRGSKIFERIGRQIARSDDPKAVAEALSDVEKFKHLHIYEDRDHNTLGQIVSRCRLLNNVHKLGLVVIDYLQLVNMARGSKDENREQQVAGGSRALKHLADVLPCPLMVLSQLNRRSEEREDSRPRVSDLRESGAIEQDADGVWLLWRKPPPADRPLDPDRAEVHLEQGKRRDGPLGVYTRFDFRGSCYLFTPVVNIHP
jgi:replicative DNA helicase